MFTSEVAMGSSTAKVEAIVQTRSHPLSYPPASQAGLTLFKGGETLKRLLRAFAIVGICLALAGVGVAVGSWITSTTVPTEVSIVPSGGLETDISSWPIGEVQPGAVVDQVIEITNTTDTALDTSYSPTTIDTVATLSSSNFPSSIAAGETKSVTFTLSVYESADYGVYDFDLEISGETDFN
jgi:hypothetical protein